MYMPHIKFQDSSISGSRVSQLPSITDRQTDGRTDGRTDRPKPICPLNFSEVGGIKTWRCTYCKTLTTCSVKFSRFNENDILAHFTSGAYDILWLKIVKKSDVNL